MVKKSDYLIMELERAEKEMIRASEMEEKEWNRRCEQLKELENDVIKSLK